MPIQKKIMGYDVSDSLSAKGAVAALEMAIKNKLYPKSDLIHHSDRGLRYCCHDYQNKLKQNDINCSMTEQYNPYENAVAERINGILKQEFICDLVIKDLEIMTALMKDSIDIYNQIRPHYSAFYHTPEQMHEQDKIKIRTYKTKTEHQNQLALS